MANRKQRKKRHVRRKTSSKLAANHRRYWKEKQADLVTRLHAQALALDSSKSKSRRHHWVPKSYLAHWATRPADNRIRTTSTSNPGKSFLNVPKNVANRKQLYRIEEPEIDKAIFPPLFVEALLGHLESGAATIIPKLRALDPGSITPEMCAEFSLFLAVQRLRSPMAIEHHFQLDSDLMTQCIANSSEDPEVRDLLSSGAYRIGRSLSYYVGIMPVMAYEYGPNLFHRKWVIFKTETAFVTSDEPVVFVPAPGAHCVYEPGLVRAGAVMFPLTSDSLLVLFRQDCVPNFIEQTQEPIGSGFLDAGETMAINFHIAMKSYSWIFETPDTNIGEGYNLPALPGVQPSFADYGDAENALVVVPSRTTRWTEELWAAHPLPFRWHS